MSLVPMAQQAPEVAHVRPVLREPRPAPTKSAVCPALMVPPPPLRAASNVLRAPLAKGLTLIVPCALIVRTVSLALLQAPLVKLVPKGNHLQRITRAVFHALVASLQQAVVRSAALVQQATHPSRAASVALLAPMGTTALRMASCARHVLTKQKQMGPRPVVTSVPAARTEQA